MDNLSAVRCLCNAICNTFYPDDSTIEMALFNEEITASADATPKDISVFRVAVALVMGYVETSRSEGGISTSVDEDAIKRSLVFWCNSYGLNVEEVLDDYIRNVESGSNLW